MVDVMGGLFIAIAVVAMMCAYGLPSTIAIIIKEFVYDYRSTGSGNALFAVIVVANMCMLYPFAVSAEPAFPESGLVTVYLFIAMLGFCGVLINLAILAGLDKLHSEFGLKNVARVMVNPGNYLTAVFIIGGGAVAITTISLAYIKKLNFVKSFSKMLSLCVGIAVEAVNSFVNDCVGLKEFIESYID